jgi:hypothetical protein
MLKSPSTANIIALARLRVSLKSAELIITDQDKGLRLDVMECKACYYLSRGAVVMQAFTKSNCEGCGVEVTFPNSRINKLCEKCAESNDRCCHCGGDIDIDIPQDKYASTIQNLGAKVSE